MLEETTSRSRTTETGSSGEPGSPPQLSVRFARGGPNLGNVAAPAVDSLSGLEVRRDGFYLNHGKRALDVLISVIGIVFSIPVFAALGLLIKLDSPGSVLYRSVRLGKNGKPFVFYKLRSMRAGAHESKKRLLHLNEVDGPVFKLSKDPRATRVGGFIRKTSLDELPQLFNILKGDMSLVGPRPPIPEEVEKYEPWERRRLDVKPGLTCLWQISGRSTLGFKEWMRLDMEYIRNQSFWLDVKILIRTLPAVVSREGAY